MTRCLLITAAAALLFSSAAHALPPTTATGIGVWYQPDAPAVTQLWQPGDPGERLILKLIVRNTAGAPLAGTQVEMWQADGDGVVRANRYRTQVRTGADGSVTLSTVLPGYIWRARHIHLVLTHPAHERLITRVLFRGDPLLAEMEYPELAIALEEGGTADAKMLFGTAEIVLAP